MSTEATQETTRKKRKYKGWIIFLSILMVFVILFMVVWYGVAPKIDGTGLRFLLTNAIGSYFRTTSNKQTKALLKKTDGWITGVCHPYTNPTAMDLMEEANIGWLRFDLSHAPYEINDDGTPKTDANGNIIETNGYINFKNECAVYAARGFKNMCVTQYPDDFYDDTGLDFRPENSLGEKVLAEMAEYMIKDFEKNNLVHAIQVTNEMGIEHFMEFRINPETNEREMLTLENGAKYIGVQLEAMWEHRGNIIIGYNLAGWTIFQLMELMKPYHKFCDYIGLDWYAGSFESIQKSLIFYDLILRGIWNYTRKPVLVNEFGYIGYGAPKTDEEKANILQGYGFNSEAEARADAWTLLDKFTDSFQKDLRRSFENKGIVDGDTSPENTEKLAKLIFDTEKVSHVYLEIQKDFCLKKYEHSPEGQAKFFTDCIARFVKLPFVCGAFVYHFSDGKACYVCDQVGCPVETGWGMVDRVYDDDGHLVDFERHAYTYDAVKAAFAKALDKRGPQTIKK